jgi:hypothetical protein
MKLPIIQLSPASCHLLHVMFKYSSQHTVLKHHQSMPFPLGGDQVFDQHKTTGNITILHTLIFMILDRNKK